MLVAGLMSGTSADGIDVAVVEITGLAWKTRVRLLTFQSVAYPPAVRRRILEIAGGAAVPASDISQMNFLLGELFAQACREVCRRARISMKRLVLIGSHGQTIYHQNRESSFCGKAVRSTLQIGEPSVIAERTGITTVGDFRPADIAAGGKGAPLVPFFDYLLYRHPRRGRVVLNIGGIANITAIPARGGPHEVIAFDTGPGNMLIDALVNLATGGRKNFDPEGRLASQGSISESLLRRLMRLPYFQLPPPKTSGREQFGMDFLERYFLKEFVSSPKGFRDAIATATAFTAESIAYGIGRFILPKFSIQECFVSGGGVKNLFLMDQLRQRLTAHCGSDDSSPNDFSNIPIHPSDSIGVPSDGKEAMAFAVLAYHTLHRQPSNVCSATGALHRAILGKVAYGRK